MDFAALPTTSIAVAVIVFAVLAMIALILPEKRSLDRRIRDLTGDAGHKNKAAQIDISALRQGLAWIYAHLRIEVAQKALSDWLATHDADGEKQHLQFMQAGFRQPKMHIYFAIARLCCGLLVTGLFAVMLNTYGMFEINLVLALAVLVFALFLGLYLPSLYLKNKIHKRRVAFDTYWDDAIGLLIICLDAGLSIEVAMRRIAHELAVSAPVLAEEFIITVADLSLLKERRLAYLHLSERMDLPSVKSVTIALIQTEKQGASIANSLRTIAQTNRQSRISRAEEKAASLGPKMTVPMIIFFLPVVFVIIIAPVVLSANL